MRPSHIPGPDLSDPIVALADPGFRVEIPIDQWLTIGGTCTVSSTDLGPWPGEIVKLTRSKFIVAEWTLASGKRRTMDRVDMSKPGPVEGDTFQVAHGANTWTATVTVVEPATTVEVAYTIQSGAVRTRHFHRRGRLEYFGKTNADGGIDVYSVLEKP